MSEFRTQMLALLEEAREKKTALINIVLAEFARTVEVDFLRFVEDAKQMLLAKAKLLKPLRHESHAFEYDMFSNKVARTDIEYRATEILNTILKKWQDDHEDDGIWFRHEHAFTGKDVLQVVFFAKFA